MPKTLIAIALIIPIATAAMGQTAGLDLRILGADGDSRTPMEWTSELPLSSGSTPGISSARIVGSVNQPGVFVLRIRMEPGAVIPPHTHPDAHLTTVLSGTVYYGMGTVADRAHASPIGPGEGYFTPPGVVHFVMAGDEPVTYEEVGYGPSRVDPVGNAAAH